MSIDAVALLRIPDWEPSDELDVRLLEDGALLYLDVPFESSPDELSDAIRDSVGEVAERHDDARGIFVLPDAAEPDGAETYEAVIAGASEVGVWVPMPGELDPEAAQQLVGDGMKSMIDNALSAMGLGNLEDMQRIMREGDPDAMKMMQIRMQGAFEQLAKPPEDEVALPESVESASPTRSTADKKPSS